MQLEPIGPLSLSAELEQWPLEAPFTIAGYTFRAIDAVVVTLGKDGCIGRGEASGVYYKNDTPARIIQQLGQLKGRIEGGISHASLLQLLPPGGVRNAVDCALWDLESKLFGQPVWKLAGLEEPRPLLTTYTCSVNEPELMAAAARRFGAARAIKLKLAGDEKDAERVRAVREARNDVWLGVDANQGFTRALLEQLLPVLSEARVALIEQPFPIGSEAWLDGIHSPIPIAADESVQGLADIPNLVGRFDVVNIKLDKCGGLSEALLMARLSREKGLEAMVGNMLGTSLAMAPAFLVGQLCSVVDLDGPMFLSADRSQPVEYENGLIRCPKNLWGSATSN